MTRIYRMRFLWPDEIDADNAAHEQLVKEMGDEWGSIPGCGSLYGETPPRAPLVELHAPDEIEAYEQAGAIWRERPHGDRPAGFLLLHPEGYEIELFDARETPAAELLM